MAFSRALKFLQHYMFLHGQVAAKLKHKPFSTDGLSKRTMINWFYNAPIYLYVYVRVYLSMHAHMYKLSLTLSKLKRVYLG